MGMRLGTFESRSPMRGYSMRRVQIQSAWGEPCDLPRLESPTDSRAVGMKKGFLGCEIGIVDGGWLGLSKIKEMS